MSWLRRTMLKPGVASGGLQLPQVGAIAAKFSADAIPAQTDNTALASWTDSVSGLALTQGTGASQPKYRTSRTGGKPAVQFAGSQWLFGSLPALKTVIDSKTYTVMIVYSNQAVAGAGCLFGNSAGGNSFFFLGSGTASGRFDSSFTGCAVPYSSTNQMTLGYSCQNSQRYPQQSATIGERLYHYGMCTHTNQLAAGIATSAADGLFAIGSNSSGGGSTVKADIQEIIVWNTVLSEMDWLTAQAWVAAKYSQVTPATTATYIQVFDGDSLTQSTGTNDISQKVPWLVAQSLGLALGQWTMQAIGGMTSRGMTLKIPEWSGIAAYYGKPQKVYADEWYNEKNNGYSAAVAYADISSSGGTYGGYAPTVKAIPNTKLCLGTSTSYNGDPDAANRDTYNALMDANHAFCDSYVPLHNDATIGVSGAYAAGSATYWFDGVHFKPPGYAIKAPLVAAGINAM